LKKKLAQSSDPNPEKGHFLHLDNDRSHSADHEIQANNLTRPSYPVYNPYLAPLDFWFVGCLKVLLEGSHSKRQRSSKKRWRTFWCQSRHRHSEQYLRNGKVDCCDILKQIERIFRNTPFQRYTRITRGNRTWDRIFHTAYRIKLILWRTMEIPASESSVRPIATLSVTLW
jgi:hypothetical protein